MEIGGDDVFPVYGGGEIAPLQIELAVLIVFFTIGQIIGILVIRTELIVAPENTYVGTATVGEQVSHFGVKVMESIADVHLIVGPAVADIEKRHCE